MAAARDDDFATLETVCKLGVILTKPLTASALRAGMLKIDTKSGKLSPATVAAQRELQDNARAQAEALEKHRAEFLRPGVMRMFVGMLKGPLEKVRRWCLLFV